MRSPITHPRKLFCDLFIREGFQRDYKFDWNVARTGQHGPKNPSGT